MSKLSEACVSAAKEALRTFSEADLDKYARDVFAKALEYKDVRGAAAIDRAIEDINNEKAQQYMEEMQRKVVDKEKFEERKQPIVDKKVRVLDTLVRRGRRNEAMNVESAQNFARKPLMDVSFNAFTPEETDLIHNRRNDIDIARAMDGKESSEVAKGIARKYLNYIKMRSASMVNSGAMLLSNLNKDRTLKTIHDAGKLLRGGKNLIQSALAKKYTSEAAKDLWKGYIKPLLNLEKTFVGTDAMDLNGKIDGARVDTMLDEIFNNIVQGKPFLLGEGKKQEMFFYWKDNESWVTYNQRYGKGSLMDAWRADIHASANQIGMANMYGSNPVATYNELSKVENEVNPQSNTIKNLAKVNFNWLRGQDRAPVSASVNSFFSTVRGISGGVILPGRVTLVSLADIANGITFAQRHGLGYFESYGLYLSGMFNAISTEESRYLAGLFKEMTDTHLGYMNRFIEANNPGDVVNNFNNIMYRYTLMDALDKGNKLSALRAMARILGDNSKFEFNALNDTAKKLLDKYSISEAEWNGIRNNTTSINGRRLLTIDSVQNLSNDEIRKIYGDSNKSLYQLRNDLYQKVYSMFDVASENSVLTPGAFIKASSNMGVRSGTIGGEILRSIMQFKMYPLEFIDRVLIQGMGDSDGIQNKLKFAACLFGASLPMSWLSLYLDNHSRGKSMADFSNMSFGDKVSYSQNLLLPGLSLMGSFLDPNNQNPNKAGQLLTTPAIRLLWEGMVGPLKASYGLAEGDTKKFKQAFKEMGKTVLPGQGLPLVAPYMRQMFGDQPYLQSGQKQIFGS